jgi:hypothetical protein
MNDIRFVIAPLDIVFEKRDAKRDQFKKEYDSLSEFEEDSIGQWLKLAKARGETDDTDQVLLQLLVELNKKVDTLTSIIKNEEKSLIKLENKAKISHIGFEYLKLEDKILSLKQHYYARVLMPVFPKREIPLFMEAISEDSAKIVLIHDKDEKDWNAYVTARERIMIREMKAGIK